MPDEKAGASDDPLESSRDLIRSAAKWLVASLGALGAVLIAGSQLSSIGALPSSSRRLYAAVLGLVAGLLGVLWSIWSVVGLLAPRKRTISELAAEWNQIHPLQRGVKGWLHRRRYHAVYFLSQNPEFLGGFKSLPEIKKTWDEASADDDLADLNELIENIASIASYRNLSRDFAATRWRLAVAVAIAATGVGLFAWAANPKDADQPPASMRMARLRNADLRGVNLVNADLTGADLTGANLDGAQLRGALIDEVRWTGATCPDGVHADDVGRSPSLATCAGHLQP